MLAALPIVCLAALFVALYRRDPLRDVRRQFLNAAIFWGVLCWGFTEALSLFHWLTAPGLAICWSAATIGAAWLAWRKPRPSDLGQTATGTVESWNTFDGLIFIAIGLILLLTGVVALCAAPTTWDSMTYHLARCTHWMQNRSVIHYPTHILRQLHMPPWSEFCLLQFILLAGNDCFVNFVQWFSMVGSVIGVSIIARDLGAG